MLAPMASAEEVTMSFYECGGSLGDGFTPGEFIGSMKGQITLDEATKVYTMPDFLGYANAKLQFTITSNTATVNGETLEGLEFIVPDETTADNIVKLGNSFGTKVGFEFQLNANDDGEVLTTDPVFQSGVITGPEDSYKLVNASLWGLTEYYGADPTNIVKRTYAVKQGSGYKFYIQVDGTAQWVNSGADWAFEDYPAPAYILVFSYPEGDDGQTGITDIEAADNNAPVEYFNLQGVRVDNPANGIYIRRQGNKIEKVVIR